MKKYLRYFCIQLAAYITVQTMTERMRKAIKRHREEQSP